MRFKTVNRKLKMKSDKVRILTNLSISELASLIKLLFDALNIIYYWLFPALAAVAIKVGISENVETKL